MTGEEIDNRIMKATKKAKMSGAEDLVRTVGERIGLARKDPTRLNMICSKLEEEYIFDEIQLASLDSLQWKELNAPIGLATAVRTLASAVGADVIDVAQTTAQYGNAGAPVQFPSLVSSAREVLAMSEDSTTILGKAKNSSQEPPPVKDFKDRLSIVGRLRSFAPISNSNSANGGVVLDAPQETTKQTSAMVETVDEESVDEENTVSKSQQHSSQL